MLHRWDAGQRLSKKIIKKLYNEALANGSDAPLGKVPQSLIDAYKAILEDGAIDGQFGALALTPPTQSEMTGELHEVDPVLLYRVKEHVAVELVTNLEDTFRSVLQKNDAAEGTSLPPREIAHNRCSFRRSV